MAAAPAPATSTACTTPDAPSPKRAPTVTRDHAISGKASPQDVRPLSWTHGLPANPSHARPGARKSHSGSSTILLADTRKSSRCPAAAAARRPSGTALKPQPANATLRRPWHASSAGTAPRFAQPVIVSQRNEAGNEPTGAPRRAVQWRSPTVSSCAHAPRTAGTSVKPQADAKKIRSSGSAAAKLGGSETRPVFPLTSRARTRAPPPPRRKSGSEVRLRPRSSTASPSAFDNQAGGK